MPTEAGEPWVRVGASCAHPGTAHRTSAQTISPEVTSTTVEVTAASFGGALNVPSGLLGRMFFAMQDSFRSSTTIRLQRAELLRSSEFVTAILRSVMLNGTIDFDGPGDRPPDFRDFLLFAAQFGKSSSSPDFDIQFDLDGDGSVGFTDFVILAEAIEAGR